MKFRVTMKTPDALADAISEAVKDAIAEIPNLDGDEEDDKEQGLEIVAREVADRWFRYGELLTVEIDTEAQTCTVVKAKK